MLVSLSAVPVSLYTGSRDPYIQTFIARSAAGFLSKKLGTTITIGSFFLNLDLSLTLKNVVVQDNHSRKFISIGYLNFRPEDYSFSKHLNIRQLELENIQFELVIYEGQEDMNLQFLIDYFQPASESTDTVNSPYIPYPIEVRNLRITDAMFRYWDQNNDYPNEAGMDYNHLKIDQIKLLAHNITMLGDSIAATIDQLQARDTCGIILTNLSTNAVITDKSLHAENLIIETPSSKLSLNLDFKYHTYWDYIEFIDSVQVEAKVNPSRLYMADLGYFAPIMFDMTNTVQFSGIADGFVYNFKATDFNLTTGDTTRFFGDVQFNGLPDFYTTFINLDVKEFETNTQDIRQFAIPGDLRFVPIPQFITGLGNVRLNGNFSGYYNDFISHLSIGTDVGSAIADLELHTELDKPSQYKAKLITNQFLLGDLLGKGSGIGQLDMNVSVVGEGLTKNTLALNLSGKVGLIEVLDYTFHDIDIGGDLTDNTFSGRVGVKDEKIHLDFLGKVNFSKDLPDFDFSAKIRDADLYGLHLLDSDSIMELSTNVEVNFSGLEINKIYGGVIIDSTVFADSRGQYKMDHFKLITTNDSLFNRKLSIRSDFFDLDLGGLADYSQMLESFKSYLAHYVNFESLQPKMTVAAEQDFFVDLRLKDTKTLSRLFMPSLQIASGSNFSGVFTNQGQILNTMFSSDVVTINGFNLNDFELRTRSDINKASLEVNLGNIILRDKTELDTTVLSIQRPVFKATLQDNNITFGLNWKDYLAKTRNMGNVEAVFDLGKDYGGELRITQADLLVNDSSWIVNDNSKIVFDRNFTRIDSLKISHADQAITIDGRIPLQSADSLNVYFNDWNMSNFDILMKGYGFDIDGIISGDLQLANLLNQPAFFSNLHLTKLALNSESLGEARVLSSWSNTDESIYVNAQIIHVGNIKSSRMLNLTGFYYPMRKKENLNFDINLENFRIKTIQPFLTGVVSRIEGLASGDFKILGTLEEPELTGNLSLMRTGFLIDYLNTYYSLQHDFRVTPTEIFMDNVVLYDTLGNKAIAKGSIKHDYLSNFRFFIDVNANEFLSMNTNQTMNDLFYGSAIVTGDVGFRGTIDDIDINISGTSKKGTKVFIPISMATSVDDKDYIVFVKPPEEGKDDKYTPPPVSSGQAYNFNLTSYVTPDANVKIFMPYNMGDLEAQGSGTLRMNANSIGEFLLYGDYIVNKGQFNFVFENLLRKKFDLQEGGRISWAGDPYDALIDVKGLYRVKTSLSSLGIVLDSTSSIRNRVNVDCIIHLTEQLFAPEIKFSIRLPNTDPDTQQLVYSVLDTTNEALITQQVISLLVLGSFSYTGASNVTLGSSYLNVISNQLSGWLSQISKDFDIGLNYKPGDKITSNELEVALSTQLFDDRVIIEGNLGMISNSSSSQAASNIVGDVDVSFKITDDGRWRLKAFNHSNTSSTNNITSYDNYAPYTQGVGISFRKEFDRISEIFRSKKSKQKKE